MPLVPIVGVALVRIMDLNVRYANVLSYTPPYVIAFMYKMYTQVVIRSKKAVTETAAETLFVNRRALTKL